MGAIGRPVDIRCSVTVMFFGKIVEVKKNVDFPGFTIFKKGNASISMGHGFHGYVTNSQRVVVSEIINGHFRIRLIGGTYLPYIRPIYI